MQKINYLLFGFLLCLIANASEAQSAAELDKRNGFKDIKLATEVHLYEGLEYKEAIEDKLFKQLAVYQRKKGYYESIGSIKIYDVEVLAYNGEVYKIKVITEKNPKLYSGLKKAFGEPTFSPRGDNYYWATQNINLTFGNNSKSRLELVYTSHVVKSHLKKDKEEEIEDISEDF
jgi:hypothetical protein